MPGNKAEATACLPRPRIAGFERKDIAEKVGSARTGSWRSMGVPLLTVSKRERGVLTPSPYQMAMLGSFKKAGDREPAAVVVSAGIASALYFLLED